MEIIVGFFASAITFVIGLAWGEYLGRRKEGEERDADEAEKKANPLLRGMPYVSPKERARSVNYATSYGSSPVVAHQDGGMDPLLAGVIGYALGSSGSNHEHSAGVTGSCAPDAFQAGGGDMGGGGAAGSWDDSSSSSSSDSSSSSSD